jgi:hypothetical protein
VEEPCWRLFRRFRSAMNRLVLMMAAIVARAAAQQEPSPAVGAAPRQPLPFSHRAHIALSLKCVECHPTVAQSPTAGMPPESLCMNCHVSVKTDSRVIAALTAFFKRKEPVPWVRLYRLPDFVSFSHKRHFGKAQVACSACHGEVKGQDVLAKEKPIGMQSCMACHDKRKANNNCDACHAIHPA